MKSSLFNIYLLSCMLLLSNCSANGPTKIVISTDFGDIELVLYDQTPQHRDNFIKLVKEGYYDGLLFHRVIKGFMIQGGDPKSKNAKPGERLGMGSPGYTVPAEFVPGFFHKRGAVAAARTDNPEKASSGSQFYIVQGKIFTDEELNSLEVQFSNQMANQMFAQYLKEEEAAMQTAGKKINTDSVYMRAARRASAYIRANPFHISEELRQAYKTVGGTPSLDGAYTVFGEVVKGMDVVDRIVELETDNASRPKIDVRIKRMRVKY